MRIRFILIIALLICSVVSAAAQNWPAFRGSNASGAADGRTRRPNGTLRRTKTSSGRRRSPDWPMRPDRLGRQTFVVTAVSGAPQGKFRHGLYGDVDSDKDLSKHAWKVYCLNKKTGKILWERTATEGAPKIKRHIKSTHASQSPVTDGKYVVAFFGSEGLFCYDFNGKLIWKQDLGILDSGWFFDPDYQWEWPVRRSSTKAW